MPHLGLLPLISEVLGYHMAPTVFLGFPSPGELMSKIAGCANAECNQSIDAVHIVTDAFPVAWLVLNMMFIQRCVVCPLVLMLVRIGRLEAIAMKVRGHRY